MRESRNVLHLEIWLAGLSAITIALTLAWPEWIEEVFGVEPDSGSGAIEWAVVAISLLSTVVFSLMARFAWRRLVPART